MRNILKSAALVALLAVLPAFGSGERWFAPSADLWRIWTANDPNSTLTVDHGAWGQLLSQHVKTDAAGVNRVAYGALTSEDRAVLDGYLGQLQETPVSKLSRDQQMAYWINFYNALTVNVILDHYPVESIRDIDISPGLFAIGPWDAKLATVEGEEISLNDIEHRILRPIWNDARIHYVLNCASVGCPNLLQAPFSAEGIDASLNAAAAAYVNNPRGVEIRNGEVTVSRIYDWFIEDFGGGEKAVIAHLKSHATPELASQLTKIGALTGTQYDWALNAAN